MLCGGAVSWSSKRQTVVAISSAEAEFVAARRCGQEVCFLRFILEHLGFPQLYATILFEDNTACQQMSQNPQNATRTKHIDLRRMFLKDLSTAKIVRLVHINTHDQHADFLTKSLPRPILIYHHRTTCGYTP